MLRKCQICKGEINIDKELKKDTKTFFIEVGKTNKCYHKQCFIEKMTTSRLSKTGKELNKNLMSQEECVKHINKCENEYLETIRKQNIKDELYKYWMDMYNIAYVAPNFYIKMEEIFSGKSKKVSKPIEPEHLLDMWQQKRQMLDTMHQKMAEKRNDVPNGVAMLWYDFTVMMNKYDSYLEWRRKQEEVVRQPDVALSIDMTNLNRIVKKPIQKKQESLDLTSILDEI